MPKIQFDVNFANGVAIDIANDVLPVWGWRYTLFVWTIQNHCYMSKLNDWAISGILMLKMEQSISDTLTLKIERTISDVLILKKDMDYKWHPDAEDGMNYKEKRRSDPVLWQNPLYPQQIRKPKDNTQTPPKTSITQRLRTDLGRSVGVTSHPTGVVKPGLKGTNLPTHRKSCVINRTRHCINDAQNTNRPSQTSMHVKR